MSPTVFRYKNYRFFFFSREEIRKHIHVYSSDGEAKFWIEPEVTLDKSEGFSKKELNILQKVIEERLNEIKKAWKKHFES
ncbi:DUF4160 domain-containing protein [Desulfobacterota bacterium AH_259_B03_O07]|nr:DUF4160 domain-containing protein [Desulfobacterota bacterium AH_259_B03_O07]